MSSEPALEDLLTRLETLIGRLADGRAPLEQLVADHEEATRLLAGAEERFKALAARVGEEPAP